ncbi:MAG TPA: hypothetical protein VF764_01820 [Steroidobacteraceae bacterium]
MPALLYGFFACYAVTGKCDLRMDNKGRDMAVFASLDDCQRFGSTTVGQPPSKEGTWALDEGHYYQCFGLTPVTVPAPPSEPPRTVYNTSAAALQRDFQANPDALTRKIGSSIVEVSGTINAAIADGAALQLAGDSWDVTAWLTQDGITAAKGISKHGRVTLRCDRIGTLVAGSGRRPAVVELRDCNPIKPN